MMRLSPTDLGVALAVNLAFTPPLPAARAGAAPRGGRPAALVQPVQLYDDRLGSQPSDVIFDKLRTPWASPEARVRCLQELCDREHPALADFLVPELERAPQGRWRDELIYAAEQTEVRDAALRDRLCRALQRHALDLRAAGGPALWSALRRYAALLPADEVARLGEFLREGDAPLTWQAALQGIQRVFSLSPPPATLDVSALARRVHDLALAAARPGGTISEEDGALAVDAFCAAAVLLDPGLGELLGALTAAQAPALVWLSQRALDAVAAEWLQAPGDHRAALAELDRGREALLSARTGQAVPLRGGGAPPPQEGPS